MYYYCIVCQGLHDERYTAGKIFKRGYFIDDTGTGTKFHLGMCDPVVKGDHLHIRRDCSLETVDRWMPVYDLIKPDREFGVEVSAIKEPAAWPR